MGWRNITVDGALHRWKCGRSYVVIKGPTLEGLFTCGQIKGLPPDLVDRGRHKITSDGMVMPGEVATFIRNKVVGRVKS